MINKIKSNSKITNIQIDISQKKGIWIEAYLKNSVCVFFKDDLEDNLTPLKAVNEAIRILEHMKKNL